MRYGNPAGSIRMQDLMTEPAPGTWIFQIKIRKLDVVDSLKLNLNADLRGPALAKMDDELRMALKGPALTLQFSAPVLRQRQVSTAFRNRSSALASAPEQRTASDARHPFLPNDHTIPGQCSSAVVRGRQRPSPRIFSPHLRNRG